MSVQEIDIIHRHWEDHTSSGNELFGQSRYPEALRCYDKARLYSEVIFSYIETAYGNRMHILTLYRITYMNLANTFWQENNLDLAGAHFLYAVWRIKQLEMRHLDHERLRADSTQEWKLAVLTYTDFMKSTGQKLIVNLWDDETYLKIKEAREKIRLKDLHMN